MRVARGSDDVKNGDAGHGRGGLDRSTASVLSDQFKRSGQRGKVEYISSDAGPEPTGRLSTHQNADAGRELSVGADSVDEAAIRDTVARTLSPAPSISAKPSPRLKTPRNVVKKPGEVDIFLSEMGADSSLHAPIGHLALEGHHRCISLKVGLTTVRGRRCCVFVRDLRGLARSMERALRMSRRLIVLHVHHFLGRHAVGEDWSQRRHRRVQL